MFQPLLRRSLVAACLTLAAVPATASAAGWQPLGQLSAGPGGQAEGVRVAFDHQGNGVAAWVRRGTDYRSDLQVSTRPAGGAWSAPQTLTTTQVDRNTFYPSISVDGDGNALITWVRDVGRYGPQVLQAVAKPAGEPLGDVETLPHTGGVSVGSSGAPSVVFDEAGTATAVFSYDALGKDAVIRTLHKPRGGSWSAPTDLTANTTHSYYPDADIADDGAITVAWREGYVGQDQRILSKTRSADGTWQDTADVLSTVHDSGTEPDVEVTPEGKAVATWSQYETSGSRTHTAVRPAAASDWTSEELTAADEQAYQPQLGGGDGEAVTLLWRHYTGASGSTPPGAEVRVAELSAADTSFGEGEAVSSRSASIMNADLATDAAGRATAVWTTANAQYRAVLRAAHREDDGWTDEETAVTAGQSGHFLEPTASHDPSGNVLLGYGLSTNTSTYAAHLSVFDRTAPVLTDVSVPVTAVSGQAAQMTAVATDDWLTATAHWAFGAATAQGSPVERAFGPGAHAVQVRAVDAAGNASPTLTRTVTVAQPVEEKAPVEEQPPAKQETPVKAAAPSIGAASVQPSPVVVPTTPPAPDATTLAGRLLGAPVAALGDISLAGVQAFAPGDVRRGRLSIPAKGSKAPLFALVATRDTTLKALMRLEAPAPKAKASAAAARKVKLPTQRLRLKAGEAGIVQARLNGAQRRVISQARGRARLVVSLTARDAAGKVTRDTKRLTVKLAEAKAKTKAKAKAKAKAGGR